MNRLLVLRLSALGDVIHTIPAVVALRDAIRPAAVSWVVEAPYAELVEIVAGVEAIPIRMRKWGKSLRASRRDIAAAVRSMRRCDASVDFQGLIKSAMLGVLAGARVRYGFDADALKEKPSLLFTNERIDVRRQGHVIEWNLDLASGVAPILRDVDVDFTPFAADPGGKLGELAGAVVLLPGAGKPDKLWPLERFREVARRIGPAAVAVWG
ncbi:MAG: glycosyltransferase family 9 protein, partial [Thermoanaerobaculia bacterium]